MVELRRDGDIEGPVVTGFTNSGYKIGGERFDQGLLLSPQTALSWDAPSIDKLDFGEIFAQLDLSPKPEFLLFGSGTRMQQPPALFRRAAEKMDVGVEAMDSRAAARTWGVLRAEERWVVAALMPLA